ncbi:uncharacterized protein LOC142975386 isoform X2 [Anticarsia gemmatalis]|uniref:uncharacterized protein LOC142975386 isoform X2 n=1 Tax=Anticarsia gemmatalis TaxID=129554 RepID=UPI003F75C7B5
MKNCTMYKITYVTRKKQLEDRGAALVNTLFERRSDRVTFAQFRNGLLAVLGGASGDPAPVAADAAAHPPEPPPQHSDDDSSGREVAPKFVFGSKKYGRRSRPPRAAAVTDEPPSPRSSSASRLDTDDKRARQKMRCRRSASAMESRNDSSAHDTGDDIAPAEPFEHNRRIDRDEALALCRGLHMDGIDSHLVERIFEDTGSADTTVGEFFDRLNASLTTTIEETSREARSSAAAGDGVGGPGDDEAGGGVPSDLVLEAWERAGVQQPRRLLVELGFAAPALRPPELERALDDELRALPEPPPERRDARALLLAAALALSRLRLELARRRADLTAAERDKLRADVAEANRRAGLLAQEVDESHARIEAELKASLRRAETRQAEASRQAAAESAAERERASAARARLEAEVSRRAEAEARLRAEAAGLRARVERLEAGAATAEERAAEGERERARLAAELRAALERGAAAAAQRGESGELTARLRELHAENKQLRDRNDELCAALEAAGRRAPPAPCDSTRGGDLSAELDSLLTRERPDECDSSPASIDQKILGHVEVATRLRDIFESVVAIPLLEESACGSCGPAAGAVLALRERVRELGDVVLAAEPPRTSVAAQTQAADEVEALRRDLLDAERKHDDEKRKLTALAKELEASLDQMKAEYDRCEEYWSGKLEEERDAYNEEQRLGDERLAELVAKIGEYERQFASAPAALPTIDERHSLEAQFTDLEDEFARYRRDKEAELRAAAAEAARLAERAAELERRLAEPAAVPGPRRRARDYHNPSYPRAEPQRAAEVRELRGRCARAEAAVRRLHARLAAADVLVKDLYVENCQLAHRRPL